MRQKFPENLLVDTWWFALTSRMNDQQFADLAKLRKKQGFNAVQLVVGIPPEVAPLHPSAASNVGPAWDLHETINQNYLGFASRRIKQLNALGFTVLVYGAWGHQIEWIGVEKMCAWWRAIIKTLDLLDVIYCVTGESNLWIGQEKMLLPDKSTDNLQINRYLRYLKYVLGIKHVVSEKQKRLRKQQWSDVLRYVAKLTHKPLFIHVLPNEFSYEVVENPELLSAVTVHTSHHRSSRKKIWQTVIEAKQRYPDLPFLNLEPWYEGIRQQFWGSDQLYAFWAARMAGASGFCYGGHGIWNVGDGTFLAHWGGQTLADAMRLDTPRLLGLSQAVFKEYVKSEPLITAVEEELQSIIRGKVQYFVDAADIPQEVKFKKIWVPDAGKFVTKLPNSGQVVGIV